MEHLAIRIVSQGSRVSFLALLGIAVEGNFALTPSSSYHFPPECVDIALLHVSPLSRIPGLSGLFVSSRNTRESYRPMAQ